MRFYLFLTSLLLLLLVPHIKADTYSVVVPAGSGNGTCSNGNVTSFSFTVTCPPPGLTAVLSCSTAAYAALLPANLSDPATASLPAPLLDMSCTSPNTTTCAETFPTNRVLKSQIMCLLLKNDGTDPLTATIDVAWVYDTTGVSQTQGGSSPPSSGAAGWVGSGSSPLALLILVMTMMMWGG